MAKVLITPPWKTDIYNQLKHRNQVQSQAFTDVIEMYSTVAERNVTLQSKNIELEKNINRITQTNTDLQKRLNDYIEGAVDPKRITDLEAKIQQMQEELTSSYKRNSDNSTAILDQTKKIRQLEEDNRHKEMENDELKSKNADIEEIKSKLEEECEILQEELKALQIQLVKTEEKCKSLMLENGDLVNRWLQKMNEEASRLNEVNDFAQSVLVQKKQVETKQHLEKSISASSSPTKEGSLEALDAAHAAIKVELPSKPKKIFEAHKGEVHTIASNLTGSLLATGGSDTFVKLWDGRTGTLRTALSGAVQSVMCVRFSPNEEFVLGTSNEQAVHLWSVVYGRLRDTLTGHTGKVLTGAFADSSKLVSGSHDRTIKLWDLSKGYCTRTIFCYSSCNALTVNSDGLIYSGHFDNTLRVWDPKNGECVHEGKLHTGQITSVALSYDGQTILTNSKDNTLKLLDVRTYQVLQTFSSESYRNGANWNQCCFSPDGRFVSAGSIDGTVCVWNVTNGKLETALKTQQNSTYVAGCTWNPLGSSLASCDKAGNVTLWAN
eukprot:TRINITY_DN5303_c0_g1_i1.p1 TRINITY_DN5303_c0_g1~~TRINITY_DN5303_c0_g1_i1.p1  ORF type:complete len:550 (+),score=120.92 TRINITY_DN5303_c0_g1_i1:166-1815(+)